MFYNKNFSFKIYVNFENQNKMKKYLTDNCTPLFTLDNNQSYSVKFENKLITCSFLKVSHRFLYKDIKKIIITADGILIYLNDYYISISTDKSEKHNTTLYDIVSVLKCHCRNKITTKSEICYPENEDCGRYKTDKEANFQITFSLSDFQIKQMLWYDYLFSDRMIIYWVAIIPFLICSVFNFWWLIPSVVFGLVCLILSAFSFKELKMFAENHKGQLQLLMYDRLLVMRLQYTDLELEFSTMKLKKSLFGLWRLKCDDYFTLVLPKAIVQQNSLFFEKLYNKIKTGL